MHQLGGELEVVEAGLAFLGLDDEVFEFPGADGRLWCALTTRLFGLGLFAAGGSRWSCNSRGGGCGHRLFLACGSWRGPARLTAFLMAAGAGGGDAGAWRELLSLAFTEDFLECFEHGHLINWLRNVRRAV
ncbi:hypothetical protein CF161_20044 [Pseudomonas sp. CF161]|nr:hypothetical protein CF161_20044 [Pseudomonas sp. CF161]